MVVKGAVGVRCVGGLGCRGVVEECYGDVVLQGGLLNGDVGVRSDELDI